MSSENDNETKQHQITYGTYILVWFALVIFTGITVTVTSLQLQNWNILTALVIATLKSGLVLFFFMHLKYEDRSLKIMFLIALITLFIIIGLTFVDIYFR